jgi:hypothetical protein
MPLDLPKNSCWLSESGDIHVLWTHSTIFHTFKLTNLCSYLYWTLYTVLQTLHPLLEDGCHDDEETDPQKKVCILQILLKFSGLMIWAAFCILLSKCSEMKWMKKYCHTIVRWLQILLCKFMFLYIMNIVCCFTDFTSSSKRWLSWWWKNRTS